MYYRLSGWKVFLSGPKWPVHRGKSYRPFFIVGSGRSGSTLLRRILQATLRFISLQRLTFYITPEFLISVKIVVTLATVSTLYFSAC